MGILIKKHKKKKKVIGRDREGRRINRRGKKRAEQ